MSAMMDGAWTTVMNGEWRVRLRRARKRAGKSQREVSLSAGFAHGYMHAVEKGEIVPTFEHLLKVCEQIDASLFYIVYGIEMDPLDEEMLRRYARQPVERKRAFLEVLPPVPDPVESLPPPQEDDPT